MSSLPNSTLGHSRRAFLSSLTAGSFVIAAGLHSSSLLANVSSATVLDFEPDLFLSIAPDGAVTILAHRSEMGTGIRTALPMVVADELGASWERVSIDQAIGDSQLGSQNTDGSRSVRRFYKRMRVAGATARTMLERAAAKRWGVDPSECHGRSHEVQHDGGKPAIAYGDLVQDAARLDVPAADELTFKPKSERTLVGTNVPITDLRDIVTGRAEFGIDARREGQLFAVIARSPVLGASPTSFDTGETLKVSGVVDAIELPTFEGVHGYQALGGVAVLATNTWAAIRGREALVIEWGESPHDDYDSRVHEKVLAQTAREPGKVWRAEGDVDLSFEQAGDEDIFSADYYVPLLAHAPMEPPCAVADVRTDEDGKVISCEVWAATQDPQAAQSIVAASLGISEQQAVVHVTLLGGGFGRKSKPDYVAEAALLSRATGKPVHVTWTREDDLRHDYYHTVAAVHMSAVQRGKALPSAWLQRSAFPPIMSTFVAGTRDPDAMELGLGSTELPYAIPNLRVESGPGDAHVRIGWMRSVAHIYHAFATCSFPDELAQRAGRDPYEYLMELLGEDRQVSMEGIDYPNASEPLDVFPVDVARLRHVTKRAAELADWGRKLPPGRALGIASHRSFLSYCANVVEVQVSEDGEVTIPRVTVVIDAGTVVHPDRVKAQMEGSAVFGASLALFGEITLKNGRVRESNFDDYPIARMKDAPKAIEVEIVASDAPPAGVGEVGVPPFAPALCNAIFAATGHRIRRLPLSKHDLSY